MRRLAKGNAYAAFLPVKHKLSKSIQWLLVFSASALFLAPLAEARQCGFGPANSGSDAMVSVGLFEPFLCSPADECEWTDLSRESASDAAGPLVACQQEQNPQPAASLPLVDDQEVVHTTNRPEKKLRRSQLPDFNREIYYHNRLEFALDVGWLPINIPFPLDILEGDPYNLYPLRYTLVPVIASLRWHVDNVGSPLFLRGNWDVTVSGSYTAIPKGPETHYFSYDMGIRRNFVPRNWRATPYVDLRFGLGLIDAKGPLGVYYAQGQDYTFTCNMGAGARYNFNSRYAISAGLNWMHISNMNLSAPQYSNYGINVYGPMFGIDVQLRRHRRRSE